MKQKCFHEEEMEQKIKFRKSIIRQQKLQSSHLPSLWPYEVFFEYIFSSFSIGSISQPHSSQLNEFIPEQVK